MTAAPRPSSSRPRILFALGVASLAAVGCDALVGLEPPMLATADASVGAPSGSTDATAADREPEATSEAGEGAKEGAFAAGETGDAGPDASPCNAGACPSGCDLTTDSANCGACGHSCLGGACEKGRCLPTVLATGSPVALAADGTNLYWTEATSGQVLGCPASGCPEGGTVLFVGPGGGQGFPAVGGISVRSGELFFVEGDGPNLEVYACPIAGCGATSVPFAVGYPGFPANTIATDSTNVYWGTTNGVNECPLAGCPGSGTTIVLPVGLAKPVPFPVLAAGGGWLFFGNPTYGIGACDPSISCAGGCAPSMGCNCGPDLCGAGVGTNGSSAAKGIAVGASAAYWTSSNLNGVFARPLVDAGASALFASAGGPGAVAVDADDVYFGSTDDGGTIYRCAVTGCAQTPTSMASGLGSISSLAVDAARVYAVVGPTSNPASMQAPFGMLPVGNTIIVLAR